MIKELLEEVLYIYNADRNDNDFETISEENNINDIDYRCNEEKALESFNAECFKIKYILKHFDDGKTPIGIQL